MKQLRITVAGQTFDVTVETVGGTAPVALAPAPVAAPVVAAPVAAPAPEGKLSPAKFDDETVAVITAAIAAVRGEGYPFQIKRIVRVKQ